MNVGLRLDCGQVSLDVNTVSALKIGHCADLNDSDSGCSRKVTWLKGKKGLGLGEV